MNVATSSCLVALSVFIASGVAWARDVQLPPQNATICVGKTGVVMHTKTQLDELIVNGVTSRNSTFSLRGQHALFTCDFDAANSIVARCATPGNQVLNVTTSFKYADLNRYHVSINVKCQICPAGGDGAGGGAGREIPSQPVPAPRPLPLPHE